MTSSRLSQFVLPCLLLSASTSAAEYTLVERFTLHIHETGSQPYLSPLVDLDGDGFLDFFAGNSLYLGKGDGDFERLVVFEDPMAVTAIGDVDSDGAEDLLGMSPYFTAPGLGVDPAHPMEIVVRRNVSESGAGFSFPVIQDFRAEHEREPGVPAIGFSAHIADLDLDGDNDLVCKSNSLRFFEGGETRNYWHVAVALGDGNGGFAPFVHYLAVPLFDNGRPLVDGRGSPSFVVANLDRDSFPDIAWPLSSDDTPPVVSVLLNDGRGGFGEPRVYETLSAYAPIVSSTATFDFDADGDLDLINGHLDSRAFSILFNDGDGKFDLSREIWTSESNLPGNPSRVDAADLNADGKPDALAFDGGDLDIVFNVLEDPAHAVVSPKQTLHTFRTMMRVGDLDNDGLTDVILNGSWCERHTSPCLISILLGELSEPFLRGDADTNGVRDVSDAIAILGYLFQGAPGPICLDRADADDNGRVELTDPVFLLGSLFLGLGELPPPARESGIDPTIDSLFCGG